MSLKSLELKAGPGQKEGGNTSGANHVGLATALSAARVPLKFSVVNSLDNPKSATRKSESTKTKSDTIARWNERGKGYEKEAETS
jgi:hypothetical protein